jgi:hypothetical protein
MSRHVKTATFVAFSNSALQRVHQGHQDIPDLNIFLKASEKVLRRFWKTLGKTTLVVLVWHSVWPLWPRSKFQGLDATGTKLYVANLPEDIQALIVRCCEKVVIAVVFVAHWQYGNMATWPQVYTIIILYISYYISINIIIYIYIYLLYTHICNMCVLLLELPNFRHHPESSATSMQNVLNSKQLQPENSNSFKLCVMFLPCFYYGW